MGTEIKKKRADQAKVLPQVVKLRVNFLPNNVRADVLNPQNGECFISKTAGILGFKNSKKTTPFCASRVVAAACKEIIARKGHTVCVEFCGFGIGKDTAYRVINEFGKEHVLDPGSSDNSSSETKTVYHKLNIQWLAEDIVIPHNGVRPKKARKL